jgi:hypothetical protein
MATQIQSYNPVIIIINDMISKFNDYSKKDLEYRKKIVIFYINHFIDNDSDKKRGLIMRF